MIDSDEFKDIKKNRLSTSTSGNKISFANISQPFKVVNMDTKAADTSKTRGIRSLLCYYNGTITDGLGWTRQETTAVETWAVPLFRTDEIGEGLWCTIGNWFLLKNKNLEKNDPLLVGDAKNIFSNDGGVMAKERIETIEKYGSKKSCEYVAKLIKTKAEGLESWKDMVEQRNEDMKNHFETEFTQFMENYTP